jgi:hypothetical protein
MEAVKEQVINLEGKLVCTIDRKRGVVEIVRRGYVTYIVLLPNGEFEVINRDKDEVQRDKPDDT